MARNRKTIRDKTHIKPEVFHTNSFLMNAPKKENAVGYCHNKKHKGFLSKDIIKQHGCNFKQCPYLEKYETDPYWLRRSIINAIKKYRKNGNTGVILIDYRPFMEMNVAHLVSVAHNYAKNHGVPPEIRYVKDYIKYYCSDEL